MERTHIKKSFVGFAHRVAPLQNVFHKECHGADLNTDVLEFFSDLQNELVGKMMDGACAISQHRRSKDVAAKDLLCHLDTHWNLDPLLMSTNCFNTCYRVTEITDEIDLSLSPEPLPRRRRTRCSSNRPKVHPASLKVKKISSKKSKLKSKCDQSNKIINSKSKVNSKSQDICSEHPFKIRPPLLNKNPELKAERQLSTEMSGPDSLVEFLGNNYKLDICNVDDVSEPSVPIHKPESKAEEKISTCDSSMKIPPVKGKAELEFEIPVWVCLNQTDTYKIAGLRQDVSVADAVPKSPEAPICKLKSKVEKKNLTCESPMKVLPFKEKHSTEVLSLKEKTEPEFKLAKQTSIEIPCPDSQVLKIPGKKGKPKVSGVKCASVETLEEARQPPVEMPFPDSHVRKISLKRRKQEAFDINDVPIETPEEARRRLAVVLLRIAGRY